MPAPLSSVAYDKVARLYDLRYTAGPHGVVEILQTCAGRVRAARILEVGCGTGHWLGLLQGSAELYGLDPSSGMLAQARAKSETFHLCRGEAAHLPFAPASFDFIYCVHAIQHFNRPDNFIKQAFGLLRPGGVLAIIGMNPHLGQDSWYVYDYFPGTRQTDLRRYPSAKALLDLMLESGFVGCEHLCGARLQQDFAGEEVFHDPILQKDGASQLSLLSDDEFAAGMARIRAALDRAAAGAREIIFPAHISLPAVIGLKPEKTLTAGCGKN
ncbi:MAG: methyltransferase domain-containing protein [Proteobacteria bacterium]|nr:methyltransferase domain-containing protein [Pseudomonadota bacterium]MBU4295576.1 methyltransferase domain-containing protein [Pseudomonadota bacterium]MCG2747695.1 methyltransferase domain-containing protein [Desulfobulbaceae bacterium]